MEWKNYENLQLIEEMKAARKLLKMTQAEFAEFLGVRRNTVARWENGRNLIPRVVELAITAVNHIPPKQLNKIEAERERNAETLMTLDDLADKQAAVQQEEQRQLDVFHDFMNTKN